MHLQTYLHDKDKERFIKFKQASGLKSDYAAAAKLIELGLDLYEGEGSPLHAGQARHRTAAQFLNCPECFPRFEKSMLKRGYVKIKEGA